VTDYYIGLLVGGAIGYLGALLTMIVMWALCAAAKGEEHNEKRQAGY
jgi:hypothetical protein